MKPFLILVVFSVFILSQFGESSEFDHTTSNGRTYIVYMGDTSSVSNRINHNNLINSMLKRRNIKILHNYQKGLLGFAARLSDTEAGELAKAPGVVSVFPEPILQLHTTRSWDFLHLEDKLIDGVPHSNFETSAQGSDTIIGLLDTGIWPESESFSDKGLLGTIPSRWKGTCVDGKDFNSSNCNRKLIGARTYIADDSDALTLSTPRDADGHGTHTASTAAGASVSNASYYGIAPGVAIGGSTTSRIAMYRVCQGGCSGSAILAAFDDAIADGVDLLSLSLGGTPSSGPDFSTDPIAIGAFHAVQRGIIVVCSAGNSGPDPQSVVNVAPWIITVAATTIDRDLQSKVVLGDKTVIEGEGINFSKLGKSPAYPLIYSLTAKKNNTADLDAMKCNSDSLDPHKINRTIVLCNTMYSRYKSDELKSYGAVGIIFINDMMKLVASNTLMYPVTVISSKDGATILEYINSTRNPTATILPTETVLSYKPAPTVGSFSSRGPSYATKNILKPDIAAPGVNIIAAWKAEDTEITVPGNESPRFNIISGTSMSCPHVSGIAAAIKSQNPNWSPAAIRSAIMTTAIQTNNLDELITAETGQAATPYDIGAGEVSPTGGLRPGLIYEPDPDDYLKFLCYIGYNVTTIKLISPQLPVGFSCPKNSSKDMISNINYPSIAVSKDVASTPVTVTRTVTNVDTEKEVTYSVTIVAPKELDVKVVPEELKFTKDTNVISYQVTFSSSSSSSIKGDKFGTITWTSKKYSVRSPFIVTNE